MSTLIFDVYLPVPKSLLNWILLIVLGIIWGSSFILMKLGMYDSEGKPVFRDDQVASLRMSIAGLVLAPIALRHIRKIGNWKQLLFLGVVGFAGNFIPAFLFTFAETKVSSGYAGMLNSFTPIFALVIGFIFYGDRLTKVQLAGVSIGTIGIVLLTFSGGNLDSTGSLVHIGAIIFATLCYGLSVNVIKNSLQGLRSFEITALSFFLIFWPSILISYFNGSFDTINIHPSASNSLMYIVILSVIGTAFAVYLFNILISRSSILFASSVTYIIPISAVLIGFSFKESINWQQIASMAVILLGVYVANVLSKRIERRRVALEINK